MLTSSKAQLKAKMLEIFRRIEKTGEELIVTDRQKPVLRVIPYHQKKSVHEVFADLRGKVRAPKKKDLELPTLGEWKDL
ncbi:MAG: prevent-host-death protein [Deltaproteobacteria bacterium]|nr:prevent-host-death protein [Deltaproteobacteria bacterium]